MNPDFERQPEPTPRLTRSHSSVIQPLDEAGVHASLRQTPTTTRQAVGIHAPHPTAPTAPMGSGQTPFTTAPLPPVAAEPPLRPGAGVGAILMRAYAVLVIAASAGIVTAQVIASSTDNGVTSTTSGAFSILDGLAWLGGLLGIIGGLGLFALQPWGRRLLRVLHILLSIVLVPLSLLFVIMLALVLDDPGKNPLGTAIVLTIAAAWGLGFYFLYVPHAMRTARGE